MATNKNSKTAQTPEQELARRSRRSFIALGTGAVAAAGGWYWLNTRPLEDEIPGPLRRVLGANEKVVRTALYSDNHLVRTYPASAAGNSRLCRLTASSWEDCRGRKKLRLCVAGRIGFPKQHARQWKNMHKKRLIVELRDGL